MIVLDASVWLSSRFPAERHHSTSSDWLDEYLRGGENIAVPNLFLAEIGGAIVRRSRDTAEARRNVARIQADTLFTIVNTDPLIELVVDTANGASLRGADAAYVALARHLNVSIITWDREVLVRAAPLVDVQEPAVTAS